MRTLTASTRPNHWGYLSVRRLGTFGLESLLCILVLAPVLWALLPDGLPDTADGRVHFVRAAEMVHAWQQGLWLPRWSANLGLGLGIPLFLYAPPLPYFLAAGLNLFGLPLDLAFKGVLVIAVSLAGMGAFRLGKVLLGVWPAVVCAAAVVYAPIALRELFIQGNAGQLLAWSFVPWALWAVLRIYRGGGLSGLLWLALAMGGAVLSHNAVALLLAEIVSVEIVVLWLFTRRGLALVQAGAGLALGLLLTAWFWMPALLEREFIQLEKIVASDFRGRFLDVTELVRLSPPLDRAALNPYYPLTLGGIQVLVAILGAGTALWLGVRSGQARAATDGRTRRLLLGSALFMSLLALFGAFMALPWSEPVWTLLPFMDLLEFPYRWHGFTAVGLGWLGAFFVYGLGRRWPRIGMLACAVSTVLILVTALVNLYPDKLATGVWAWSPTEVVHYELSTGAIGTTSLGEFTPVWATAPLMAISPYLHDYPETGNPDRLPAPRPASLSGVLLASAPERGAYAVTVSQPMTVTINQLYFPGWQATADGQPLPVARQEGSGLLTVGLPAGSFTLILSYSGTPLQQSARGLAGVGWLGAAALAVWMVRRGSRTVPPRLAEAPILPAVAAVGAVIGLVLLLQNGAPGWFRVASPPGTALPARQPLAATFGDEIRVLGIDPAPPAVTAGDAVAVTAYLQATQRLAKDYGLFLHLDRPDGETVAAIDVPHPDDIPTSHWPPGLYVRAPLRLRTPADALPIRYRLRLGVTDPDTGDWLPVEGADVLDLGAVWLQPAQPPAVPAQPIATYGGQIHLLDARYMPEARALQLHWKTDTVVATDYVIFIHLLDEQGQRIGQLDGVPYGGLYPLGAWRPGQVVEDVRPLPAGLAPVAAMVGIYEPGADRRLPAAGEDGADLPDQAVRIPLH
ncbi:MAG: hypothetical protein H3C34_26165 [Caldilineaceae bacterium]|nr:hypothetical protein [Caldilineaceae bacterium]